MNGRDPARRLVTELLISTRDLERAARSLDLERVRRTLDRRLLLLSSLLATAAPRGDRRLTRPPALAERRAARALDTLAARRDELAAELQRISFEARLEDAYRASPSPAGWWLDLAS